MLIKKSKGGRTTLKKHYNLHLRVFDKTYTCDQIRMKINRRVVVLKKFDATITTIVTYLSQNEIFMYLMQTTGCVCRMDSTGNISK